MWIAYVNAWWKHICMCICFFNTSGPHHAQRSQVHDMWMLSSCLLGYFHSLWTWICICLLAWYIQSVWMLHAHVLISHRIGINTCQAYMICRSSPSCDQPSQHATHIICTHTHSTQFLCINTQTCIHTGCKGSLGHYRPAISHHMRATHIICAHTTYASYI